MPKTNLHAHGEAYKLMTYANKDRSVVEIIWNSRDGVTPFIVSSRDGVELTHVDWYKDVYAPNHVPAPGDRIFVDLTRERARDLAIANAERFWETYPPSREQFDTVEDLAAVLETGYLDTPGSPDLIVVIP